MQARTLGGLPKTCCCVHQLTASHAQQHSPSMLRALAPLTGAGPLAGAAITRPACLMREILKPSNAAAAITLTPNTTGKTMGRMGRSPEPALLSGGAAGVAGGG